MSTILQALQRAQAERRPGDPPGPDLTAVLGPAPMPAGVAEPRRARPGVWIAVGAAGAGLALAIGWWLGRVSPAGPAPGPMAERPVRQEAATAAIGPPSRPVPPTQLPTTLPTPASPGSSTEPAAESIPAPSRMPPPALVPAAPSPPAPAPAPAAAATPAPALKTREALPEALRSGLPPLRIGGAIGADRAADRMLLVDGRVLREGDAVAPGLVLLSIGARQAIFGWRDQRFTVAY